MKSTQTTQKCTFIYVTLLLLLALLFLPLISSAQTTVPFEKRYETSGINGDLTIIGNSILGPSSDTPYYGTDLNNNINMVYVDIDGDPTDITNSMHSHAKDFVSAILKEYIPWTMEPFKSEVIDVKKWVADNAPHWLNDIEWEKEA